MVSTLELIKQFTKRFGIAAVHYTLKPNGPVDIVVFLAPTVSLIPPSVGIIINDMTVSLPTPFIIVFVFIVTFWQTFFFK